MSEISKFITIIRPEFMMFCKDACRAASLNHLMFRIAYKCKDQPREKIREGKILWYSKNEQITSEMSNAWGVCKVGKEVNELVRSGLLGRCSNPDWGVDRTKHFFFGQDQCAKFVQLCEENNICVVHLDLPPEVRHLIYLSNANDRSIKCSCQNGGAIDESIECNLSIHPMHSINPSVAFDRSIEAIPKNSTKIELEDSNKETPNSQQSNTSRDITDAANADIDTPTSLASLSNDDLLAELQRRGALPASTPTLGTVEPPHNDAPVLNTPPQGVAANATPPPKPARKPRAPKEATRPEPPQMPASDMAWSTRKCMMLFDYWRGAQLIGSNVMQASKCAKGLAEQYTEEDVTQVYKLMNDDPYWVSRQGADICNVANNIPKYIKKIKPPQPPQAKPEEARSMTRDDADKLAIEAIKRAKEMDHVIQAEVTPLDNDAWGITVHWNTRAFEKPYTFPTQRKFEGMYAGIAKIWQKENAKVGTH